MEHLVQFTFSVDDDAIQERLEKSAYAEVVDKLVKNMEAALPKGGYYGDKVDWREFADKAACDFLEAHKGEVIDAAARLVAEKMVSTKVGREAIAKAALAEVE